MTVLEKNRIIRTDPSYGESSTLEVFTVTLMILVLLLSLLMVLAVVESQPQKPGHAQANFPLPVTPWH